jgi:hypothetical protein
LFVMRRRLDFRFRRSAMLPLALVCLALALTATACGGGDDEDAAESRPQPKLTDTTAVGGGQPRERELLRTVMNGMQQTTLTRVSIGPVKTRRKVGKTTAVPLEFTTVGGTSARLQWDEWIVAGAFSRRLQAAGLPPQVDGGGGSGAFTARPKLSGQPDPKPLSRAQEATLVKGIRAAARQSGGTIARLEVHRPHGAAVALTLASDDPARFLENDLRPLMQRLDPHRMKLEGLYLAVLDDGGRVVLEWASWTRNPAGSYWVRRDLANCSPIRQSEPPGADAPPDCPV